MKRLVKKIQKGLNNPKFIFLYLLGIPLLNRMIPDKAYLKIKFRLAVGKSLDLKNPETFNEKLQWLKLYNRKEQHTIMADKYAVREYIANTIGEEYLIPLLGVWDNADDIDFDKLPDKFVLKCNHNSGKGMCICDDKSKLDISKVRRELNDGLKEKYFYNGREWCYKNIRPRIIAEEFMENANGELVDYKFMCFGGEVKCVFVCQERFSDDGLKITIVDKDWNKLPFERKGKKSKECIEKPYTFDNMVSLAEELSQDHPFLRVDFYEYNREIRFGELTFYPSSGMEKFSPEEWDYTLGCWVELPATNKGECGDIR